MDENKGKGITPRILTIYFLVQYIFYLVSFQFSITLEYINLPLFTVLFIYAIFKLEGEPGQKWIKMYIIYISILVASLSFTTFSAPDAVYSFMRILLTCWLLFTMMIVFFYTIKKAHENKGWATAITNSLLLMLVIAVAIEFFIPEWQYVDGTRWGGGINPNGMGYLALFSHFWFLYQLVSGVKNTRLKIGLLLSFTVIIFTMSRTILFSLVILYVLFLVLGVGIKAWKLKIKNILLATISGVVLMALNNISQSTVWYQKMMNRLTNISGSENLLSRQSAWDILLTSFYRNPLVGESGWWTSSSLLRNFSADTDTSHNLYLRILAETGIIGSLPILILPLSILIGVIYYGFKVTSTKQKKQMSLVSSMILSLFIGMIFEDRYLVGIGGFNTGPIVWVMAMGIFLIYDVVYS